MKTIKLTLADKIALAKQLIIAESAHRRYEDKYLAMINILNEYTITKKVDK